MAADGDNVVRLRGLPWSVGNEEIINFLEGCSVNDIHFTFTKEGKPSGEVYVELSTAGDLELALSKNQQYMGKRYIDVFAASKGEMEWVVKKFGGGEEPNEDAVVRLRGLPYSCDRETLLKFFDGLPITPNGVSLMTDPMGNATGEAYVQFADQGVADIALKKHKERIGHRYIEIFKSSLFEARSAIAAAHKAAQNMHYRDSYPSRRPAPYERYNSRPVSTYGRRGGRMKGFSRDDYYGEEEMSYPPPRGMHGSRGMQGSRGGGRQERPVVSNFVSDTGFSVHMRGLPFSATDSDIMEFFYPLVPSRVEMERGFDGRLTGEADVDFSTKIEVEQALKKDRAVMKHRYIELFNTSKDGSECYEGYGSNWKAF